MDTTFYAAEIQNPYLRRGYLILALPLVIIVYVVLMSYDLTRVLIRTIWNLLTYRLPNDARTLKEDFAHCWKGETKKNKACKVA